MYIIIVWIDISVHCDIHHALFVAKRFIIRFSLTISNRQSV